ncbi:hypothetical protein FRC96_02995 [Lujinxingia vulgaris]|uniref:CENP-V/GFA domain-containing protein n=1 Tax=Lujinxingia vulgaris TaxID=2600176 RepID=A0A5C6XPT2_9DELT|nr:hypothetical protein [Lujinxingia vulgaris]TXD42650.1 hypothetical protein FRC96_02995 [Lujinxingia vulgaris]
MMESDVNQVSCTCGSVTLKLTGKAIACLSCYCDDCQAGARQIETLPGAGKVTRDGGGTEYVMYRNDRMEVGQGAPHLTDYKLRDDSATSRMVASCCNSPMYLNFSDSRHWVSLYRARFEDDAPPLDVRMCTKFASEEVVIPDDVPSVSSYSLKFMGKLLMSRVAMAFGR